MPIGFQDSKTTASATAGYLKFLHHPSKRIWLGALFIMNALGEPIEFAHARVHSPNPMLWRPDDLRSRCMESLCEAMFDACPVTPDLLLYLDEQAGADLFTERIRPEVPVACVVSDDGGPMAQWVREPEPDSRARDILNALTRRGLLIEPFERAETGLREVYSELLS